MTRRNRTLLASFAIALVALIGALYLPVNYLALGPGEADNVLGAQDGKPIITVGGSATQQPTTGKLLLTTVSVSQKLTLGDAITKWLQHDYAVVPYELEYPPSQSTAQTNQQNQTDMTNSQDSATTAALDLLGKPSTITIGSFSPGSKADGPLKTGDRITSVNGTPVTGYLSLHRLVGALTVGQPVNVGFSRAGVGGQTASFATIADPDAPRTPLLGIVPSVTSDIKVTINLAGVGGPSAGMMYALGIINKLSPPDEQLTGGRTIAGTGEISPLGDVMDIGGIQEKLLGAKQQGATVFLVPAGNCAEAAAAHVSGLQLVKVPDTPDPANLTTNLQNAYNDLRELSRGDTDLPSC